MVTLQEVQDIVSRHEGGHVSVTAVIEIGNIGFRCVLMAFRRSKTNQIIATRHLQGRTILP